MIADQHQQHPPFEQLLATLARLQGVPEGKLVEPIELLKKEIELLRRVIGEGLRSQGIEMESLRKKMGVVQEESQEMIGEAENFVMELDKNVKETERECKKLMEKLEKERLQREIEMKSSIDDRVLDILEQNKELEIEEEVLERMVTKIDDISQKQFAQRKQLNASLLKLKLELVDTTSDHQKQVKVLLKEQQAKKQELKKRLQQIEAVTRQKIEDMRISRTKTESILLRKLQKRIEAIQ